MKKKKLVALVCFTIGLGVILYPTLARFYYDFTTQREVAELIESMETTDWEDEAYEKQLDYNQQITSNQTTIEVANVGFVEAVIEEKKNEEDGTKEEASPPNNSRDSNIIATLHIPKINLAYPIYDGATEANLLKGVARIEGTSYPVGGMNTHSVISGHNGLVSRTYFSHIKKLVTGDLIQIHNPKEILTYEVYDTAIIEPTDTGALAVIPGQDTVTLLTCTWPPPGTHRYLVFAKRVAEESVENIVVNE